jgi:hypothetical protein
LSQWSSTVAERFARLICALWRSWEPHARQATHAVGAAVLELHAGGEIEEAA